MRGKVKGWMNEKHCPVSATITSYNQTISFSTQINSAKLCYLKCFAPIYASYLLVVSTASFPSVQWTKVPNFCCEEKQVSSLSGKRTGSVFMESHPYLVAFWNTATADKRSLYSKRWLQPPPASLPPACQFQRQEANPPAGLSLWSGTCFRGTPNAPPWSHILDARCRFPSLLQHYPMPWNWPV